MFKPKFIAAMVPEILYISVLNENSVIARSGPFSQILSHISGALYVLLYVCN